MAKSTELIKMQESMHKVEEISSDKIRYLKSEFRKIGMVYVGENGNGYIKPDKLDKATILQLDKIAAKYNPFKWMIGKDYTEPPVLAGNLKDHIDKILDSRKSSLYFSIE